MDIRDYQLQAKETDQVPGKSEKSLMVPLLGLAGETGSLLTEYKKHLREGDAYRLFREQISEELGDILWYVANIATKANLDLEVVAERNLAKIANRWRSRDEENSLPGFGQKRFDDGFPDSEQLPRHFQIQFKEVKEGETPKLELISNDEKIGDCLTDNTYGEDGYRFHDVFHLSYAAVLGWSPVTRKLLKRKRKSDQKIDEVEDGGRAIAIEEGISALVFSYAEDHSFLEDIQNVDSELLTNIQKLTSHLEVKQISLRQWETAILAGFEVWRQIKRNRGGFVIGDIKTRTLIYKAND